MACGQTKALTELVQEESQGFDIESYSYSRLYSSSFGSGGGSSFGSGGRIPLLSIIDIPSLGGQVHIHGYGQNRLTGGRLYSYDYSTYRPLNGYEVSMADAMADSLGLKKKKF